MKAAWYIYNQADATRSLPYSSSGDKTNPDCRSQIYRQVAAPKHPLAAPERSPICVRQRDSHRMTFLSHGKHHPTKHNNRVSMLRKRTSENSVSSRIKHSLITPWERPCRPFGGKNTASPAALLTMPRSIRGWCVETGKKCLLHR